MKLLICTQAVDENHPILGFFIGWIKEFAQHFDEVHVICLIKGEHSLPDNVYVYSLGKEEGENKLKYLRRFYKYFSHIFFKVRVDYVFFHMGAIYNILASPFFFIRRLYKTKFYWWKTHGHINLAGRIALFFIDRIYTAVAESFPIATSKRVIVGHAIDTTLFNFETSAGREPVLLFVGRLSKSKRVEQVLQVTKELLHEGVQCKTRIIGKVVNSKYYQDLVAESRAYDLNRTVTFIESMPHNTLVDAYHSAKVFMNPSDNDGLDKVILEAMATGVIPITGNLSFKNILSQYNLFIQKGDVAEYVKRIRTLMELPDDEYEKIAVSLRALVVSEHNLDTLTKRIFDI
jgi:glycosyltransferase involved in cell wall biosynthesis